MPLPEGQGGPGFAELFAALPVAVVVVGPDDRIARANAAAEQMPKRLLALAQKVQFHDLRRRQCQLAAVGDGDVVRLRLPLADGAAARVAQRAFQVAVDGLARNILEARRAAARNACGLRNCSTIIAITCVSG